MSRAQGTDRAKQLCSSDRIKGKRAAHWGIGIPRPATAANKGCPPVKNGNTVISLKATHLFMGGGYDSGRQVGACAEIVCEHKFTAT